METTVSHGAMMGIRTDSNTKLLMVTQISAHHKHTVIAPKKLTDRTIA